MKARTGQRGQVNWGLECWDRTAGTGHLGQDRRDKTTRDDSQERTIVAGKRQQDDQSRAGQDRKDRTTETGQP
jgi:hypothetical protein